jgi:hypothetical protein
MQQSCAYGSVRGASGNRRPYRDKSKRDKLRCKCSGRLRNMRGVDQTQSAMFSYLSPENRVRKEHPLRAIRVMVDQALGEMSPLFDEMYSEMGRPSIPPEKLLRAQLLRIPGHVDGGFRSHVNKDSGTM